MKWLINCDHWLIQVRYGGVNYPLSPIPFIFTISKRNLGEGNVFTPLCHSVHGGGVSLTETPLDR